MQKVFSKLENFSFGLYEDEPMLIRCKREKGKK